MRSVVPNAKFADINPGLGLLVRLRWLAVAGQLGLCAFSDLVLHMVLPWRILLICMAVTAGTNIIAEIFRRRSWPAENLQCGFWLLLDTVTLTVMLYWTAGSHNPFAIFYLLQIAMATILLSYRIAWVMVLLCGACYALLFTSPHMLHGLSGQQMCGSLDFHLQGMLMSLILVGIGIVFFIGRLKVTLARKEAELQEVRIGAVRNERFAALATLAAGVAHEMATPLGTIAIVSEDLEQQAQGNCSCSSCMKDAQLIRSEVERCRAVLEKLREQATGGSGDPVAQLPFATIPELLKGYLKQEHWQRLVFENQATITSARLPQTALLQSLAVLIKNACQATQTGQPVMLTVRTPPDSVVFIVEDSGQGMSLETLVRLGEPFFTTKEPGGGMGLGLFLVRMFVERINGKLKIDSSAGKGTRIQLTIPLPEYRDEDSAD